MANEEAHLTPAEIADKAWQLAEKIRFPLFTTWDGERQRLRPLTAHVDRDAHARMVALPLRWPPARHP